MADAIYTILKPIISNKQYKYIRSHNTYQNQWNDITKFVDSLLSTAETVYAKNLEKNIISSITLRLRDKPFLTKEQNTRIDALHALVPNTSIVASTQTSDLSIQKLSKQSDIALIPQDTSLIAGLDKEVRNNSKNKGYLKEDGTIALKTILLKRIHLCLSAERRGLDFDLDDEDIKRLLERKTCYYTGSRFTNSENYRRTIDRVDSSKGYVKGNVVACTHGINQVKNALLENEANFLITAKQLKMFADKITKDL